MKSLRPVIVLLLAVALSSPSIGQTDDPLTADVKPAIDAWNNCVLEKATGYSKFGQSADAIARKALFDCRDERASAYQAVFHLKPSRAADIIQTVEGDLLKRVVSTLSAPQ
jgi:hypothetical protein